MPEQELVTKRFEKMFSRLEETGELQVEVAKIRIADEILAALERQKLSQTDLARRLKTSRAYVTKILQGTTNFTLESLVRIAQALECRFEPRLLAVSHLSVKVQFESRRVDPIIATLDKLEVPSKETPDATFSAAA